jgi:hypothetical protein
VVFLEARNRSDHSVRVEGIFLRDESGNLARHISSDDLPGVIEPRDSSFGYAPRRGLKLDGLNLDRPLVGRIVTSLGQRFESKPTMVTWKED